MKDENKVALANSFRMYLAQNGYREGLDNCERMEHALMAGALSFAYCMTGLDLNDPKVVSLGKHLMMQRSFIASFANKTEEEIMAVLAAQS